MVVGSWGAHRFHLLLSLVKSGRSGRHIEAERGIGNEARLSQVVEARLSQVVEARLSQVVVATVLEVEWVSHEERVRDLAKR